MLVEIQYIMWVVKKTKMEIHHIRPLEIIKIVYFHIFLFINLMINAHEQHFWNNIKENSLSLIKIDKKISRL